MNCHSALATSPSSWTTHFRETVSLGLPLIGAQLAQMALNITNTLVLGRLGANELAAAVIGWQLFYLVWMFGSGFAFAVMPLVANAMGAGTGEASRYLRMGFWACFAYSSVMSIILYNSERIFLALGQDLQISRLAGEYVGLLQWSLFAQLGIIVLRSFLGALKRPGIILWALVLGVAMNVIFNMFFVLGAFHGPMLGMRGAGFSTLLSTSLVGIGLLIFVSKNYSLRTHSIFARWYRFDSGALIEVVRLGWPIAITIVAEVALFTATSFMMGWVGPKELAAHGIAIQLSGIAFMTPLGLAAAATVRVGYAYGRQDRLAAMRASTAAMVLGMGFACLTAVLFLAFPFSLIALYLGNDARGAQEVIPYAVTFLSVAGLFQLVDTAQGLANGCLRGLKDARLPMLIAIFSYWAVGVPLGYWLTFHLRWGGVGIWWGLAGGLACAAALMSARLVLLLRRRSTPHASCNPS